VSKTRFQGTNIFQKKGSWFRDIDSRFILFRGVNFASRSKIAPYLPIAPPDMTEISMSELETEIQGVKKELDLLKLSGFNMVRLLTIWKAIEPRPNPNLGELLPEGQEYLRKLSKIMDALYERGIHVFLDFHQDLAHDVYGGDGFPDWALAIDEKHPKPTPAGFKNKVWYLQYFTNESLKYTYESFWKNDLANKEAGLEHFPARTHLEKTIGQTVKFFKSFNGGTGHPSVIGVEPFNEPFPGIFSGQDFETKYLFPFYRNVNSEIRKYDDSLFILFEPQVHWNVPPDPNRTKDPNEIRTYIPENVSLIDNFGQNGALSFHYYDGFSYGVVSFKTPESMVQYEGDLKEIFLQLSLTATNRGLIPFLTEFGTFQESQHARERLNIVLNQIESNLLNFTIWNYNLYNTEEGKDNWNFENLSLLGPNRKPRNIDVVARPYPMKSSAEPSVIFFDINSKHASIMLKGKVCDAPTIIYIPYDMHYSPEFTVWATSNEMKWDKYNFLLQWYPAKNLEVNQIIIAPGRKYNAEVLPNIAKEIISKTMFINTFS
jgi:hypothetical protein